MSAFQNDIIPSTGPEFYRELCGSLQGLISQEPDPIAQMANACALLFHHIPKLNWLGFYLIKGETLVVGPFQGKPACTRIKLGRGVCGTVAQTCKTIVVKDVHEFEGHIACDAASRSEIVLPLMSLNGKLWGVLDCDSPQVDRFTKEDEQGLEEVRQVLEKSISLN
jgi:L-methionine (R)-S-oxide reductase